MSRWAVAGAAAAIVITGAGVALLLLSDDDETGAGPGDGVTVEVTSAGATHEACLLLADAEEERRRGLMGVTDLGGFDGMLFVFPTEEPRSFWMRNTPMPLSIAFYDGARRFVSAADMEPCGDADDCPVTASAGPAQYAVEVPQGELAALGMTDGSQLDLVGSSCGP